MAKYYGNDEGPIWLDVRQEAPCPCCGATRGCGILMSGEFARCLTTVSLWPVVTGGWLHPVEALKILQDEELPVSA